MRLCQHLLLGNGVALLHGGDSHLRRNRTAAAAPQQQYRLQGLADLLSAQLLQQQLHCLLPCLPFTSSHRSDRRLMNQRLHGAVIADYSNFSRYGNPPCLQGITQCNRHHIAGAYHPVRFGNRALQNPLRQLLCRVHPEVPVENIRLRNRNAVVQSSLDKTVPPLPGFKPLLRSGQTI